MNLLGKLRFLVRRGYPADVVPVDGNVIVILRDNSSALVDEMRSILNNPGVKRTHPQISVFGLESNDSSRVRETDNPKGFPQVSLYKYVLFLSKYCYFKERRMGSEL